MRKIKGIDFLIIINLISIIILILLTPEKFELFSSESNLSYCLVILINIILFVNIIKNYFNTWIRYDVLFLIGYFIVHFQIPLMESMGIELSKPDYVWINIRVVNYATWLSAFVLLFWMLGFILFLKKKNKKKIIVKNEFYRFNVIKLDYLLTVFLVLFLALVGKDFLKGAYDGTVNWGTGATYIFILLQAILYLRIIYFFVNNKHIKNIRQLIFELLKNKIFVFILVSYLLIFLSTGDRGPIMQVGIIIISAYSIYIKKTSLKTLLLLVFLGSFVFTLIRMGRTSDTDAIQGKNILERGVENFQTNEESFNPTEELATSVRILYRALDLVPDSHPYLYGTTIFFDVVVVIPFGASSFITLTGVPLMYQSSPNFFTIMGQGDFFTYGEGSEIIADLYINFGIYGAIIIMFFFGYFISSISYRALILKNDTAILIFLILSATAIYINRANFLMPLRDIMYPLVISWFLIKKNKLKHN